MRRPKAHCAVVLLLVALIYVPASPARAVDCLSDCPNDIDLDGEVDFDDAFWVFWFYTKYPGQYYCPFDVNADGVVNVDDAWQVYLEPGICPGQCGDGVCDVPERPGNCSDCEVPRLLSVMRDPPSIVAQYDQWGVELAEIVYSWCFDSNEDGLWDAEDMTKLMNCLDERIPPDFAGYIILDWEQTWSALLTGPTYPLWDDVVADKLELLAIVRSARPNAKLGFYGLPLRVLGNQTDAYFESMRDLGPIWDAVDAVFPSGYDLYHDDVQAAWYLDAFRAVIELALEVAGDKPVFIFTYNRYHDEVEPFGFQTIPFGEYAGHLGTLLYDTEYQGKRPAGLCMWAHTEWYWQESQETDESGDYVNTGAYWDRIRVVFEAEMLPGETIEEFILRTHPVTYDLTEQAIWAP